MKIWVYHSNLQLGFAASVDLPAECCTVYREREINAATAERWESTRAAYVAMQLEIKDVWYNETKGIELNGEKEVHATKRNIRTAVSERKRAE